ncbi:MAG: SpoIVB peptidase S55 domain-containing protein [Armatimonadota bacterium]|nr:hypothetical protein [Armatimonadota bacterium]MCX7776967.1 hypothetical protein [Armatimonadota bacterium]MDW8024801.1 SpoIVB peptidase S55 domain-containing protein [Armatimonadota bacterium]
MRMIRVKSLSTLIRLACWILCALALKLNSSHAIIGIEDLKPGMKGVGKTVFEGVKVESFSVEIIDVLKGSIPYTDVVLVRVGGKNIEQIGGVCAGMSGSPVIINGELAGAIAHAEPLSDTTFAYMTPAKDMLALFKYEEGGGQRVNAELDQGNHDESILPLYRGYSILPASPLNWDYVVLKMRMPIIKSHLVAVSRSHAKIMTPLMLHGLSGRAAKHLQRAMNRYGMLSISSPSSAKPSNSQKLEMGSAIAVQFAHGDISLSALGTLTYAGGGKFVAIGHPLLQRGSTQFGLAGAYIHKVVKSLVMPFKIGSPLGGTVGVVTQDRERGIAGYFERSPDWVQLQIVAEGSSQRQIKVSVAPDKELLPAICGVVLLDAVDKAFDRVGLGTAELNWSVKCNDDIRLERHEKLYSETDVAAECASKFARWLEALMENEFKDVQVKQIEVNARVTQRRVTARVCKLSINGVGLRRGEEVELAVHIQPFGESIKVERLKLRIPKDAPSEVVLVARGKRATDEVASRLLNKHFTAIDFPSSFDELVGMLKSEPSGTEVLVEIWDASGWRMLKLIERSEATERFTKHEGIDPQELLQQPYDTPSIIAGVPLRPIATARVQTAFAVHGQVEAAAKVE